MFLCDHVFLTDFQRRKQDFIRQQKDNTKVREEEEMEESGPVVGGKNKITRLDGKKLNLAEMIENLNKRDKERGKGKDFSVDYWKRRFFKAIFKSIM